MKVFVVLWTLGIPVENRIEEIIGVFSDKEKAGDLAAKILASDRDMGYDMKRCHKTDDILFFQGENDLGEYASVVVREYTVDTVVEGFE